MPKCTNNMWAKGIEVGAAVRRFGDAPGMRELYALGAFRHEEDVAYARIRLERGAGVAEIAAEINASYASLGGGHRCDPVFPPS